MREDLNGWERLWLVVSLLWAVPALFIAYDANSRMIIFANMAEGAQQLSPERQSLIFWQSIKTNPRYQSCITDTLKADSSDFAQCETTFRYKASQTLLWTIIPPAVLYAFGQTIAWIIRGFRDSPTRRAPRPSDRE